MTRAQPVALGAFVLAMSVARMGAAQQPGGDVATAQALFDDGKRLMAAGKYAEACPKLVESQRLDPGGGTLFAIALCHEAEGRTATAWADYNLALAEAKRDGRKDREEAAAAKEKALEAKLTKVRVVVNDKTPGLALTRDGFSVGEAQWGTALPIDPGEHAFTAKAPGKIDWTQTVSIVGEGKTTDVVVPELGEAPKPPPPVVPPMTSAPPPPVTQPQPTELQSSGINAQKAWAVVAGGVGILGLGVGAGFGASAISKWHEASAKCPNDRCTDPSSLSTGKDAGRAADLSTVLVGVGAGALIAGIVLWITAPKSDHKTGINIVPTASRDGVGVNVGGAL